MTRPLIIVTGASGSGKSALRKPLTELVNHAAVVIDTDDVLSPLAGVIERDGWSGYRNAWLHIAQAIAQNGRACVLMAPFTPDHLEEIAEQQPFEQITFILLRCDPSVRTSRLLARGACPDLNDQLNFGALRDEHHQGHRVDTSTSPAHESAHELASLICQILEQTTH